LNGLTPVGWTGFDVNQTAEFFGFLPHEIRILLKVELLKPLGKPPSMTISFFLPWKFLLHRKTGDGSTKPPVPSLKNDFINFDDPIYVAENMKYLLFQLNARYVHQLGALCSRHLNCHRLVGVTEIQRTVVTQ